MIRNILTVIVAFIAGGIAVFCVEMAGHAVYPIPSTVDQSDMKQIAEYVKTAPAGALLFVLLAQSAGSVVGGFVTGCLGKGHLQRLAIVYGILALLMASLNLVLIPHPVWMIVASLILPMPLSWAGSLIAQRIRRPTNPPSPNAN